MLLTLLSLQGSLAWSQPLTLAAGRYALEGYVHTSAHLPILEDIQALSHQRFLITLEDQGGQLTQHQRICSVSITSNSKLGKTRIPERFVRGIEDRSYPVTLTPGASGTRYRADVGINHAGWSMSHQGEDMPKRQDDPRVLDADGDGSPGLTMELELPLLGWVDVYVVQRVESRYHGTLLEDGSVEGYTEMVSIAQQTIGSSSPFFRGSPKLSPYSQTSYFRMVPSPGVEDCATLEGFLSTLPPLKRPPL